MSSSLVETSAGPLAYDERGSGPLTVLLPAGAHTRADYDAVRDALGRTIALDWPGHGDSPPVADPDRLTASAFADAAEDAIAQLAPQGAVIVGNSIGGFSAARLALRRPELVRALVLVDSGGFLAPTAQVRGFCALMGRAAVLRAVYPAFARRYMRAQGEFDRAVRDRAIAQARDPQRSRVLATLWGSFSGPEHDLREEIPRLTMPTLVAWGRRDPVMPVRVGHELASALPDGRLAVFETGHVPFASDPDGFVEAVRGFGAAELPAAA